MEPGSAHKSRHTPRYHTVESTDEDIRIALLLAAKIDRICS